MRQFSDIPENGWQPLLRPWSRPWSRPGAWDGGAADSAGDGLVEIADFGPDPGNLRLLALLPDDLPPGAPLVVVLHGCTQTAAGYAHDSGWMELAGQHGFALLLPEQRRANNPNRCFDWFEPGDTTRGQGEVASIRAMVAHLLDTHGLDRRRVFITGLSAGGAMTSALLATYPEVFAGGAIVAGLPFGCAAGAQEAFDCMMHDRPRPARAWGDRVRAASRHRGPWPRVSVWHGSADATVRPSNAAEIVKQWLDVHGLQAKPSVEDRVDGYAHRLWRDRDGRDCVEAYAIAGMDHGTPIAVAGRDPHQACGTPAPYVLDVGICASWRTAQSWGLLRDADRARPDGERRGPGRPGPRIPGTAAPGWVDPATVISRALRAAGLLKGR